MLPIPGINTNNVPLKHLIRRTYEEKSFHLRLQCSGITKHQKDQELVFIYQIFKDGVLAQLDKIRPLLSRRLNTNEE